MGDNFNKNVLVLLSGTVIAQVVTILFSPLLTRLYTPVHFGEFALLFSLASVLTPLSMGRYEQAIIVAKDSMEARTIAKGAAFILCVMSALVALILVAIAPLEIVKFEMFLFALPVFVFFSGLLTIITQYVLKEGKFNLLNGVRIWQSVATVLSQIGFAFLSIHMNGLIVGAILGVAAGFLVGLQKQVLTQSSVSFSEQFEKMKIVLKANRDFPVKNSFPAVLDALSVHMPVIFLSHYYPTSIVGQYALAVRIVSMPINFIGTSVGQVFFQSISNKSDDIIKDQFKSTLVKLSLLAIIPCLILLWFGPLLFGFVFGTEWTSSGLIASILIVPYALRLIVSPLSSVLIVKRSFRMISIWQFSYFIGTAAVLFYFSRFPIEKLCFAYAISEGIFYAIYFLLIRRELYR